MFSVISGQVGSSNMIMTDKAMEVQTGLDGKGIVRRRHQGPKGTGKGLGTLGRVSQQPWEPRTLMVQMM